MISEPSNPAKDFARNYELVFNNPTNANYTDFTLNAVPGITLTVELNGTALNPTVTGSASAQNFTYDGKIYEAVISSITGGVGNLTIADNFKIDYYSTVNEYKPLPGAPANPGSYVVKVSLVNVPDDGNSYVLSQNKFYFNIEKGTIKDDDFHWQYTHTALDGTEIVAKWDGTK